MSEIIASRVLISKKTRPRTYVRTVLCAASVAPSRPSGSKAIRNSDKWTDQPTNRPTSQPISQLISQPTSQPNNQPTNQLTIQPTNQPASQPTDRPTNQPTNQPITQRAQPLIESVATRKKRKDIQKIGKTSRNISRNKKPCRCSGLDCSRRGFVVCRPSVCLYVLVRLPPPRPLAIARWLRRNEFRSI